MNEPKDKKNFIIEITPEIMDELNRIYMNSDIEPVVTIHYSPYWVKQTIKTEAKD